MLVMILTTYLWRSEGTIRLLFTRQPSIKMGEIQQRVSCMKLSIEWLHEQGSQNNTVDDTFWKCL